MKENVYELIVLVTSTLCYASVLYREPAMSALYAILMTTVLMLQAESERSRRSDSDSHSAGS